MIPDKLIAVIAITCACYTASSLNAATIPAGTALTITTVSLITSKDVVGRSISVNGRNVAVKTNSVQPGSPQRTARQAQYGHTAGTLVVTPGTKMQFQLVQPVTL